MNRVRPNHSAGILAAAEQQPNDSKPCRAFEPNRDLLMFRIPVNDIGSKEFCSPTTTGAAEFGTFPGRTRSERKAYRKDRFEPSPATNFRDDVAFRQISTSDKAKSTAPRLHPYAPRLPEARVGFGYTLRAWAPET